MKTTRIIITLTAVLILSLIAVNIPTIAVHHYWKKIDQFSRMEKYKSGLEYGLKAKKLSKQWGMNPAYIKSLIYEVKCREKLGAGDLEIINLFRAETDSAKTPVKELITALYLEKLFNYYLHHFRYERRILFSDNEDVSEWNSTRITREILTKIYELNNSRKLRFIPFKKYQKEICSETDRPVNFPTVYDYVTWHSIDILQWSSRFFNQDFISQGYTDQFFIPMKEFLRSKISITDSFDLKTTSMLLYQDLLKSLQSNYKPGITMQVELQRLNSLRGRYFRKEEQEDQKYNDILKEYRKKAKDPDTRLLLDYAFINEYDRYDKMGDFKRMCLEITHRYPSWKPEVKECRERLKSLSKKNLEINANNIYDPDRPVRINVSSENNDTAYINIFRINPDYSSGYDISIWSKVYNKLTRNCIKKELLTFKNSFLTSEEKSIDFGKLNPGTYLIALGHKKDLNLFANVIKWQIIKVSGLTCFYHDNSDRTEIYVVKKKNGEPVRHADVTVFSDNGKKLDYTTDHTGCVRIIDTLLRNNILLANGSDSVLLDAGYHYDYSDNENTENITIFTDRAVYRPGQKIYFKGIFDKYDTKQKTYVPVTNRNVTVYLKNYDYIYRKTVLKTNDFGSFTGSFDIPSRIPLGEMTISTNYGESEIEIEEYKPTKMRLTVLPYETPATIGDSLKIRGFVKYLNGLPARNISVSFTVKQMIRDNEQYLGSTNVSAGSIFSDQYGRFTIRIKTERHRRDKQKKYMYEYSFLIRSTDEFGDIQKETSTVDLSNNSGTANLKIKEYIFKQSLINIPVDFKFNENPAIPESCRLKIYKLRTKPNEIFGGLDKIPFDSLQKETLVLDKTAVNQKDYSFNASILNKQDAGFYVIELTAALNNRVQITDKKYFTLLDPRKTKNSLPINNFFLPLKDQVSHGETANFIAGTNLQDAYCLFSVSKNDQMLFRKWIHLSKNQKILSIPITEKYRGGFRASFVCYASDGFNESHVVNVPFDNKKLLMSFQSFRNLLYPGEEDTWTVQIKTKDGKPADAEMTATLYDQALDEIRPNTYSYFPFSNLEEQGSDWYWDSDWEKMDGDLISGIGFDQEQAIENDIHIPPPPPYNYRSSGSYFPTINWNMDKKKQGKAAFLYRRKSEDKACTKVQSDRDLSYTDLQSAPPPPPKLTVKFNPPIMTEEYVDEENSSKIRKSLSITKIRKNFRETVFFVPQAKTNENGTISFRFTMPDALTSWKMLGIAHTRDLKTGTITNELVTRKDIMIIPNWPRFIRSGDTVRINARIENNSSGALKGIASLEIKDAANNKNIGSIIKETAGKISIRPGSNSFAEWKIAVPKNVHTLTLRMKVNSGNYSDGEELTLPVLPDEILKTETLPICMQGNIQKTFNLKNITARKNIRNYRYVFEFTTDPHWSAINSLAYLADYPYECAEQLFNKYMAYCLAEYASINNSLVRNYFNQKNIKSALETNPDLKLCLIEETPWVSDAKNETEQLGKLSVLFNPKAIQETKTDLLEKIKKTQNSDGGIAWFKGMESDFYISCYLLEAIGKLKKTGELANFEKECPGFLKRLIAFCDKTFIWMYNEMLSNHDSWNYNQLVHYAYARSYFVKEFPNRNEQYKNYLFDLKSNWQKYELFQRPMIALTLHRNKMLLTSGQIIESLNEFSVKDENKCIYWFDKKNPMIYAGLENQSIALELYTETNQDPEVVNNIRNWIYFQKKNNYWSSTISTARICYLLITESGYPAAKPAVFQINIGKQSFKVTNDTKSISNPFGFFRKEWNAKEITPDLGNIKILPIGSNKAPAWGAVYWQYFEKMKSTSEKNSGLWIKKQYFIKKTNGYHPLKENEQVKTGDEIAVRLNFGTDKALSYVHLKDLRPSCFEPISKNSGCRFQMQLFYYEYIRDASQNFFIERLPVGSHFIEYQAGVTHTGYFQTGNASIQCMYAPEFAAYSGSEIIKVF